MYFIFEQHYKLKKKHTEHSNAYKFVRIYVILHSDID